MIEEKSLPDGRQGFIGWLILILIALALAKYFFDWSIFDALASEKGKETITYIENVVTTSWNWVRDTFMSLYEKYVKTS